MRLSAEDREELRLFKLFLDRRATKDEPLFHAYAEVYGEVVFTARDASKPVDESKKA